MENGAKIKAAIVTVKKGAIVNLTWIIQEQYSKDIIQEYLIRSSG